MKTTKTANRIRGAKPSTRHRLSLLALVCCASFQALANPLGAQVVSGSATLTQSGSTLTVTNSPNSILNWQSFSIGASETTRFIQQIPGRVGIELDPIEVVVESRHSRR